MNTVTSPFCVYVMETPADLQMKITDLQCDSDLKIKFNEVSCLEFYQKCAEKQTFVNSTLFQNLLI